MSGASASSLSMCRICKRYGCCISNHNKCSICGKRGHTKNKCHEIENLYRPKAKPLPIPDGFAMRRSSTATLSQAELDMATRVYLGCLEEELEATLLGSFERACKLTGVSRRSMVEVRASIQQNIIPEEKCSQRGKWPRSMPRHLLTQIHRTIQMLHNGGIMTTVRRIQQALDFHHGKMISRRQLTTLLHHMGYTYDHPGPKHIKLINEKPEMVQYRLRYLRAIKQARQMTTIVYLDESYVNLNHHTSRTWLKNDSKVLIPSGKGPRYIIYGAGCSQGWVGEPQVFASKDGHEDYHDGMNADHFEELFIETCKAAAEQCGNCTFVMDNASYHKRLTSEKDSMGYWNKLPAADVKLAWSEGQVPGQASYVGGPIIYKKQVIEWLRKNPPQGVCRVKEMARSHGHDVLLLPPYRPELNAIEKAWGVAKNFVAQNNNPSVNFAGLKDVIGRGFEVVKKETWRKLDLQTQAEEASQRAVLEAEDAKRESFRQAHPDLVFTLDGSDESSDDNDAVEEPDIHHETIMSELSDGLEVPTLPTDEDQLSHRGGVFREEVEAAEALLSLQLVQSVEE